jgi:hypothetical protein
VIRYVQLPGRHCEGEIVRLVFADFGPIDVRIVRVIAPGYYSIRRVGSFADRLSTTWIRFRVWIGL